jgi:hypothetical protein
MFMDISSEMIHGLLPVFLVSVLGAGPIAVGLIEGVAEATASITKIFSGALSDYLLSGAKMIAVVEARSRDSAQDRGDSRCFAFRGSRTRSDASRRQTGRGEAVHGPARASASRSLAMTPSPTQRCMPLGPRYRHRRSP